VFLYNAKSAIRGLLRLFYDIYSPCQLIYKAFKNIKYFLSSGYQDEFIDKQINIFRDKCYKKIVPEMIKKA